LRVSVTRRPDWDRQRDGQDFKLTGCSMVMVNEARLKD
jgi:hypothetical protein